MELPYIQLTLPSLSGLEWGGTVRHPAGGGAYLPWTSTAGAHWGAVSPYLEVCDEIGDALDTGTGSPAGTWICELVTTTPANTGESGFRVRRADGAAFDITFDAALQDYLRVSASYAPTTAVVSAGSPYSGFWPDYHLEMPDCSYLHERWIDRADGQAPQGEFIRTTTRFRTALLSTWEQRTHVTTFLRAWYAGRLARVWLRGDVAAVWSESQRAGYVDCWLAPDSSLFAEPVAPPSMAIMRHAIRAIAV